ncbi:hypothetical protein [Caulobacter sp. 1776]|uniref:hypothetical protein n=1 Tax=Caulobacter sp. 1776 TaxID=3156420 RepID=UPI0033907FF6
MNDQPINVSYSNPDEQAEVVVVGDLGWLRFRSRTTGELNEMSDLGEEDPQPIDDVRKWASNWNRHGTAGWPDSWILSIPTRPMKAKLAAYLLNKLKPAEITWAPVSEKLFREVGRTVDLAAQMAKLPPEAPAVFDVGGGYRFMITAADQVVMVRRKDGLAKIGPYGALEDLGVRLFGRLLEEGEVVVARGLPTA